MPLKIRKWDDHYETNDTRKLKTLHWVKLPNQQDSLAYRLIAGHKRGAEIFAAWVLMVQVASKGKREERGNLPLSPDELGIVTGFPAEIFKLAIDYLKSPKIGWIEHSPDAPGESPEESGKSPARRKEGNGTEEKEESLVANRDESLKLTFDEARKAYPQGKKRGLEPEWQDFRKKHGKKAHEIIPLLLPAILRYKARIEAEKIEPQFIKHFQGWLSESRWTEEHAIAAAPRKGVDVAWDG